MTVITDGSRRLIGGVDQTAHALGLRTGQTLAHAQALVPDLHILDATPEEDEASLLKLTHWCIRYSPIVAPDLPDGIWIDIAGSAHLFGGEEGLVEDLVRRLTAQGVQAMACVADAPGSAWAVARYSIMSVVPPGRSVEAVATLPVAALRLPMKTVDGLHRLGVERVGQLAAMPRGPMVRRFGRETALRLDQAFGHVFEPLNPLIPKELPSQRLAFAEPVGRMEDLRDAVGRLSEAVCRKLVQQGEGARRLDLIFERVDKRSIALRVGTAKASRDAKHLAKLFDECLQTIDPGFGIDAVTLLASKVEPLNERQLENIKSSDEDADVDLSHLVDRLGARLGTKRVYRLAPVESRMPERTMRLVSPLAPPTGQTWPETLPRPTRLIDPPEPVTATALLPDHPPRLFVWRKVRHRVVHADGPERITGEWWRSAKERTLVRDYYRVEDERGARFWLFRDAPADQGGRWWLHGLFS
mgnify:CR=1 FL=1